MTSKGNSISLAHVPSGSTIERDDDRVFIWYPPITRYTVTLTVPPCCPSCGRPLEPTATVNEAMAI
jgi:hypothetical protein